MEYALTIAQIISISAFFSYGLACFFNKKLLLEFERYGLINFMKPIGFLEILGSLGLLAGFFLPQLTFFAAAGLVVLMSGAIAVRIKIKDTILQMAPAFILLFLNIFILYQHREHLYFW